MNGSDPTPDAESPSAPDTQHPPEPAKITGAEAKAILAAEQSTRQVNALAAIQAALNEHRCVLQVRRIEQWTGTRYDGTTVELLPVPVD